MKHEFGERPIKNLKILFWPFGLGRNAVDNGQLKRLKSVWKFLQLSAFVLERIPFSSRVWFELAVMGNVVEACILIGTFKCHHKYVSIHYIKLV